MPVLWSLKVSHSSSKYCSRKLRSLTRPTSAVRMPVARQVLAMAGEQPAAKRIGDGQVAPVAAQVVAAVVVNAVGVDEAAIRSGDAEEGVALVLVAGADGGAAEVEVVGREGPLGAAAAILDAEDLVHVEVEHRRRCRTRCRS